MVGRRLSRLPAPTAMVTWTRKAVEVPNHTYSGRIRVPMASEANIVLSGSSARKISPKAVTSATGSKVIAGAFCRGWATGSSGTQAGDGRNHSARHDERPAGRRGLGLALAEGVVRLHIV